MKSFQDGISSRDVLPSAPPLDVELNPTPQVLVKFTSLFSYFSGKESSWSN